MKQKSKQVNSKIRLLLEHRFYQLAKEANRYIVKNGNEPTLGNPTEEKQNESEEFIDYSKIFVGTL